MSVGSDQPGRTAGPSFELFYESDYVLPHLHAAWLLVEERLRETEMLCARIAVDASQLSAALTPVAAGLRKLADALASSGASDRAGKT